MTVLENLNLNEEGIDFWLLSIFEWSERCIFQNWQKYSNCRKTPSSPHV